jgi:D-alanyl-D-alanine carboxypeptidase
VRGTVLQNSLNLSSNLGASVDAGCVIVGAFPSVQTKKDGTWLMSEEQQRDGGFPWSPRSQRPAQSYTSLRRYIEEARIERIVQESQELPIIMAKTDDPDRQSSSQYPPLPRPGTPLFGPSGLITRQQRQSDSSDNHRPSGSSPLFPNAIGRQRNRGTQPEIPVIDLNTPPIPRSSDRSASRKRRIPVEIPVSRDISGRTGPQLVIPGRPKIATASRPLILDLPEEEEEATYGYEEEIQQRRHLSFPNIREWWNRVPAAQRIITSVALVLMILLIVGHSLLVSLISPSAKRAPGSMHPVVPGSANYVAMPLDIDHPPPVLWAESAFLLDETNGATLYAKNPYEQLPMASTTKMMTAVVALSHATTSKVITITADSVNVDGTKMGLKEGEKYTLGDLLYGMLLPSANDVAAAIAIGVGGNMPTFVDWMNQTASALGLSHTHYTNPHGLDEDGHYSCARDLAVLGRYAISLPAVQKAMETHDYTIQANADHPKHSLENMHQPLWWYPGADGGKPGWTGAAQFVDVLSAVRNNHHLIAVIMRGKNDWVTDIRSLLNWGFDDFTWISPHDILQKQYIPFADSYQNFAWDTPSRTITDGDRRYYLYTGYTLTAPFTAYFDAQGGLDAFGFPISIPTPGSGDTLVQKFQKANISCVASSGACQRVAS